MGQFRMELPDDLHALVREQAAREQKSVTRYLVDLAAADVRRKRALEALERIKERSAEMRAAGRPFPDSTEEIRRMRREEM